VANTGQRRYLSHKASLLLAALFSLMVMCPLSLGYFSKLDWIAELLKRSSCFYRLLLPEGCNTLMFATGIKYFSGSENCTR